MSLQIIVNGLLLGGVYALAAAGFSIVWGVTNVINMAHGALIMVGAYLTYMVATWTGIDPFLAIPISAAACFGIGYATQRGLINRIIRGPVYGTLILTFGVSLVLVNIVILLFSADTRSLESFIGNSAFQIGSTTIPTTRFVLFVASILLLGLMHIVLTKTRLGRTIRAVRQDPDSARLCGASPAKTYALTFAIAAALAAIAGSFIGMLSSITPVMGNAYLAKGFAVTVLGGLGSMTGTLIGGLLLGLIEAVTATFLGQGYAEVAGLALLVLFLAFRPSGLFGKAH